MTAVVHEAPLLDVRDLRTYFKTDDGIVKAVDGVSFSVRPGQTLGVVGESGSGKSVTMMSILSLNPKPGRIADDAALPAGPRMEAFLHASKKYTSVSTGQALFRGENLLEASKRRLRALRGSEISMIFQDPMTSLNPVLSVGSQLVEAVMLHRDVTQREARELAIAGLQEVGIPRAERRVDDYPHQFSGGMSSGTKSARSEPCACARSTSRRTSGRTRRLTSSRASPCSVPASSSRSARFSAWSWRTRSTKPVKPVHGSSSARPFSAAATNASSDSAMTASTRSCLVGKRR